MEKLISKTSLASEVVTASFKDWKFTRRLCVTVRGNGFYPDREPGWVKGNGWRDKGRWVSIGFLWSLATLAGSQQSQK